MTDDSRYDELGPMVTTLSVTVLVVLAPGIEVGLKLDGRLRGLARVGIIHHPLMLKRAGARYRVVGV